MRRKKERSKQGQTNKQGKATQHTQGSHFSQEKLAASGGTRTHDTLYSRQNQSVLARLGALLAVLFHRIRTTSAAYHFRLPLSTSGSALVHVSKRLWVRVPQVELNFLLSFLSTCYLSSTYFYLSSTPFCVPVFNQLCLVWNRERVAL